MPESDTSVDPALREQKGPVLQGFSTERDELAQSRVPDAGADVSQRLVMQCHEGPKGGSRGKPSSENQLNRETTTHGTLPPSNDTTVGLTEPPRITYSEHATAGGRRTR